MTRSALIPLLMKVFCPLSTYASPSRIAVVRMPWRSEPAPGSVIAIAVISEPSQNPGSQRAFCSSWPVAAGSRRRCRCGRRSPTPLAPTLRQLLVEHDVEPVVVDATAAVLRRHHEAEHAQRPGPSSTTRAARSRPSPIRRDAARSPCRRRLGRSRGTRRGRRRRGSASWRCLLVLSCDDDAGVDQRTSTSSIPQASKRVAGVLSGLGGGGSKRGRRPGEARRRRRLQHAVALDERLPAPPGAGAARPRVIASTGATQASEPSKAAVHSAWVRGREPGGDGARSSGQCVTSCDRAGRRRAESSRPRTPRRTVARAVRPPGADRHCVS